jgi:hypothetical protein
MRYLSRMTETVADVSALRRGRATGRVDRRTIFAIHPVEERDPDPSVALESFHVRKDERVPTPVGAYVLGRMAEIKLHQQVDLVRASETSDSTVSRLIYIPGYNPDHDTVVKLAGGLRLDVDEFSRFIRSGAASPTPTPVAAGEYQSLIEDVTRALADDSPLSAEEKAARAGMIDLVIDPVRKQLHRPSRAV